jgi:electron transfer flavoprotein beta subunit
MNIVVLVKQTPDTAKLSSRLDGLKLSADGGARIVNPWDEYGIEEGLQLKSKFNGKVTALCVGKPEADEALKRAIAMGVDEAVLVSDPALAGIDSLGTAKILATAIKKIGQVDVVFAGRSSIDGNNSATAVQVAALLDMALISYVAKIETIDPTAGTIRAVRSVEAGREMVSSKLPAVITVVKEINEPRYPSFINIRKAAKQKFPVWGLADLSVDASDIIPQVEWSLELSQARTAEVEIIEGAPAEVAKILADKLIVEKVI